MGTRGGGKEWNKPPLMLAISRCFLGNKKMNDSFYITQIDVPRSLQAQGELLSVCDWRLDTLSF